MEFVTVMAWIVGVLASFLWILSAFGIFRVMGRSDLAQALTPARIAWGRMCVLSLVALTCWVWIFTGGS